MSTIDDLHIGEKAIVLTVSHSAISSKMAEMGLVEGVEVCVAFKAPFGDPIAIELNGTLLSLRRKEASLINIRLLQT